MSDLICRKSMTRCQTPGMCAPHGGCPSTETVSSAWLAQLRSEYLALGQQNQALTAEIDESAAVIDQLSLILAGISVVLKGEEQPLHRHGHHDLVDSVGVLKLENDLRKAECELLRSEAERAAYWKQRAKSAEGHLFASDWRAAAMELHKYCSFESTPWDQLTGSQRALLDGAAGSVIGVVNARRDARAPKDSSADEVTRLRKGLTDVFNYVEGNTECLVRDLVNWGTPRINPNDFYTECEAIKAIASAALNSGVATPSTGNENVSQHERR